VRGEEEAEMQGMGGGKTRGRMNGRLKGVDKVMADSNSGNANPTTDRRGSDAVAETGWANGWREAVNEGTGRLEREMERLRREMGETEAEVQGLRLSIEGWIEKIVGGGSSMREVNESRKKIRAERQRQGELEGVLREMQAIAEGYARRVLAEERRGQRMEAAEKMARVKGFDERKLEEDAKRAREAGETAGGGGGD
jgi:predicted RNase H-like nuclease (RuvC/YqgF family)